MSYTVSGSCPTCGKPIWSKSNWDGAGDPPVKRSCTCAAPKPEAVEEPAKPVTVSGADPLPVESGEVKA